MSKYWVASHITGFFSIYDTHSDVLKRGSRGAGFSISRGTTTSVEFSPDENNHIHFNGKEVSIKDAIVTNFVLNHYLKLVQDFDTIDCGISIFHEFEIPLSSGFGASASGALGSSFALNDLLKLNRSEAEIFQIAHSAEVLQGGGLGDILALYTGGWEYRIQEGAPFIGKAENILANHYRVATVSFGEMSTKSIIKNENWKQKINSVGDLFLDELCSDPTIQTFGFASKQFSISSMLATPNVMESMNKYSSDKIIISQIMLGDGIFILYQDMDDLPSIPNLVLEEICHSTIKRM